jgi:hypothetical protein
LRCISWLSICWHGLQTDAHHDQQADTAERERSDVADGQQHERQHGDGGEVQRTRQGDPGEHLVQVLGGLTSRPDARDEAAVRFMLSATSIGLKVIAL